MNNKEKELQEEVDRLRSMHKNNVFKEEEITRKFKNEVDDLNRQLEHQQEENEINIDRLEKSHEFALRHFESDKLSELRLQNSDLVADGRVKDEKISQLQRLIDIDADIIDVKQLVTDLLAKIPTMDLKNLTINTSSKE